MPALSSKLWFFVSILLVAVASFAALSRKYVWPYATRRADPPSQNADLSRDSSIANDPEVLLKEANRLGWLFNWPKAGPFYVRVVTEGLGPQRFHGHVAILANEHTSSAGEMVAPFAQQSGLATIVGMRTADQLLSGSAFKTGFGYMLGLPVAGYLTWEGKLIEGKGVALVVNAVMTPEHLLAREDPQMEHALRFLPEI